MKFFKYFIIPVFLAIILFFPSSVSAEIIGSEKDINDLKNFQNKYTLDAFYNVWRDKAISYASINYPNYNIIISNENNYYFISPSYDYEAIHSSSNTFVFNSPSNSILRVHIEYDSARYTPSATFVNTVSFFTDRYTQYLYTENLFIQGDPVYDYLSPDPLDLDISGFMEWLDSNPAFAEIIRNNAPYLDLDSLGKIKFLMEYYDDFGKYSDSFAFNSQALEDIALEPFDHKELYILRNVLKMQYNKYINSKTPPVSIPTNSPYIPSDNPVVVPSGTPSATIVIENNNDANYYYLREIIRLLNIDINNNNSFQYTNSNFFNSIIDSLNDVLNDLYLLLAPVNSITDKLVELNNNLLNIIPSGSCNYDESFWEYMLTPTYSGFDDLQQICIDKFPVLDQITEVPDPDQLLIGSSQSISLADSSSDSSLGSSETFSFTAPASFANGAFSNIEIPIIDFSRFSLAISAFKGIISVFALSIFSKWLIKFAPKLLNGYSSSD